MGYRSLIWPSSADDGNTATNTIDNNLSTRWSANGSGQWIQYDLGGPYTVSQLLIAFYRGDERSADFEVLISNDADDWNSVLRKTSSGTSLQQESFIIPNTPGRYIRIVGYGNSSNTWNSITEIDILGTAYIPPDITAPSIDITSPTGNGNYETSEALIQLTGTASDDNLVTEVRWTDSKGSSGIASGTASWTISDVALQEGSNTITVTAKDAAGNEGSASPHRRSIRRRKYNDP